jgi:TonB family protein
MKFIHARRYLFTFITLAVLGWLFVIPSTSESQQATTPRKLLERSAPVYPPLARSMALQGSVKVNALVAPDGTVRTVEIKGGHPVLAQAAANTVRRWRWEPASHETHELVEVKFSPE